MIGLGLSRPLVVQNFQNISFTVGVAALPINANAQPQDLITSFVISNPVGGVSVFLGPQTVTVTGGANPGLEIPGGTAPEFHISQERQMYELQAPLLDISKGLQCAPAPIGAVPFAVFDMSRFFLVAGGAQIVTIMLFPEAWI